MLSHTDNGKPLCWCSSSIVDQFKLKVTDRTKHFSSYLSRGAVEGIPTLTCKEIRTTYYLMLVNVMATYHSQVVSIQLVLVRCANILVSAELIGCWKSEGSWSWYTSSWDDQLRRLQVLSTGYIKCISTFQKQLVCIFYTVSYHVPHCAKSVDQFHWLLSY